jgi:hypothetical protein
MSSHSNEERNEQPQHPHLQRGMVVIDTTLPDTAEALARAATIAVAGDMDLDAFMHTAFSAYLAANPRMREEMENHHALAYLEALRQRGVLPVA